MNTLDMIRIDYVGNVKKFKGGVLESEELTHKELYVRLDDIKYIAVSELKFAKYKIVFKYTLNEFTNKNGVIQKIDWVHVEYLPSCININ